MIRSGSVCVLTRSTGLGKIRGSTATAFVLCFLQQYCVVIVIDEIMHWASDVFDDCPSNTRAFCVIADGRVGWLSESELKIV